MNNSPIGVFDSGLGGLSVWREIVKILPEESIWYYADSANCPYGGRTEAEILQLSTKIVDFLLEKKCKLIVIACNTITSAAIDYLRVNYDVPFVGIEPAIKSAALHTQTGHIGVLATKATLNGKRFRQTSKKYAKNIQIHTQTGEGFVEIVEEQRINTPKAETLVRKYVQPMIDKKVDKIVLGCTHYPFLIPVFEKIVPSSIEIIDPSPAVARQVKRQLKKYQLESNQKAGTHHFFTTGDQKVLNDFLETI